MDQPQYHLFTYIIDTEVLKTICTILLYNYNIYYIYIGSNINLYNIMHKSNICKISKHSSICTESANYSKKKRTSSTRYDTRSFVGKIRNISFQQFSCFFHK